MGKPMYVVLIKVMESIDRRNARRRLGKSAMLEEFELLKRADPSIQATIEKVNKEFAGK